MDISPLINHLQKCLRRLLRSRGQSREDTEDLVQEAFLRLHAFMRRGQEVREPEAFLVRTALNLVADARRQNRPDRSYADAFETLDLVDQAPLPEEILAAQQQLLTVRRILETQLSARTREVYLLHRLDGFTYEEIAQRMSMSVRTVEYEIARATSVLTLHRQKERGPDSESDGSRDGSV